MCCVPLLLCGAAANTKHLKFKTGTTFATGGAIFGLHYQQFFFNFNYRSLMHYLMKLCCCVISGGGADQLVLRPGRGPRLRPPRIPPALAVPHRLVG